MPTLKTTDAVGAALALELTGLAISTAEAVRSGDRSMFTRGA